MKTANYLKKISAKGFTLIELLVVIAVLGVLAAAVVAAINPSSKINAAKDSTVKSDLSQIVNALQAYYSGGTQAYPLTAAGLSALSPNELKSLPSQQTGAAVCSVSPNGATTGTTYCYVVNAAGSLAAVWGSIFTTSGSVWCWDSTIGAFKTSAAVPTQASPTCP